MKCSLIFPKNASALKGVPLGNETRYLLTVRAITERSSISVRFFPGQLYLPRENGTNAVRLRMSSGRVDQRSGINSVGWTKLRGSVSEFIVSYEIIWVTSRVILDVLVIMG